MDYLLRNVDDEFYKKVKQVAAEQNRTIKGLILNLLTEEINREDIKAISDAKVKYKLEGAIKGESFSDTQNFLKKKVGVND